MEATAANSCATVADLDSYMLSILHVGAKAQAATAPQKGAALVQATRWMQGLDWDGTRATQAQPLAWPRVGVVDADGYEIAADVIPWQIRDGCCEFAYRLLLSDRAADAKAGVQLGTLKTSAGVRQLVPPSALDLFGVFLRGGGGGCLEIVR